MKRRVLFFLVTIFVKITLAFGFLLSRTHLSIPGATDIELLARCELTYFDTRLQPMNTLILACPRMEMIRLWPLPIKQTQFEDWWKEKPETLNG
jgi:hypothetical protein